MNDNDTKGFMHPDNRTTTKAANIHTQFFEHTAEEHAEQEHIAVREMSIFNLIDSERAREIIAENLAKTEQMEEKSPDYIFLKSARQTAILKEIATLPNSELLDDEKRYWLVSGVMDKGVNLSKDVKIQDDGTIHILVDTSDDFSPETLAALSCNPWHLMPPAPCFYSQYGTAQTEVTRLIKERIYAYLSTKEPKKKVKADYKTKFYKNTAKQSKPSPMLMSLVGKTK